jgi:hypothetical protein
VRKLALLSLAAVMALSACGGSNATTQPGSGNATQAPGGGTAVAAGASCLDWCGSGSANITVNGTSTTITGGACLIEGGAVDARFGDWWNGGTATSEVVILAYQTGSKSPTIAGKLGVTLFVLGDDAKATVGGDGSGTFSGTNSLVSGTISGTWTCK